MVFQNYALFPHMTVAENLAFPLKMRKRARAAIAARVEWGLALVQLAGLEPSPGAQARLFWNPVTRTGVLFTTGLPFIPREKIYELWAIAGKEVLPAGVFTVKTGGRALFRLPPLPEGLRFDKFAVTVEPAGGVPKPTGPMVLASK